jgi:hypothetical protein
LEFFGIGRVSRFGPTGARARCGLKRNFAARPLEMEPRQDRRAQGRPQKDLDHADGLAGDNDPGVNSIV